jgi:hypothetical protein
VENTGWSKARRWLGLMAIMLALCLVGRFAIDQLVGLLPEHEVLITKVVVALLAVPIVYLVLAPMFRLLGVKIKK